MCYDIIDQIYDNYYAYLACRRHEEHALLISSHPPSTNDPAPSLALLTSDAEGISRDVLAMGKCSTAMLDTIRT